MARTCRQGEYGVGKFLRHLLATQRGATAVEYGLIVAMIVIAMIGSLGYLGEQTSGMWSNISNEVTNR